MALFQYDKWEKVLVSAQRSQILFYQNIYVSHCGHITLDQIARKSFLSMKLPIIYYCFIHIITLTIQSNIISYQDTILRSNMFDNHLKIEILKEFFLTQKCLGKCFRRPLKYLKDLFFLLTKEKLWINWVYFICLQHMKSVAN